MKDDFISTLKSIESEPVGQNLADIMSDLQQSPKFLESDMLRRIAKEKNGDKISQVKDLALRRNSDVSLKRITELAFIEQDDETKVRILCGLDGVRVPTASAILAWHQPERFGVIDIMACRALCVLGFDKMDKPRVQYWTTYLGIIREAAERIGERPFDVDRRLWTYGRKLSRARRVND